MSESDSEEDCGLIQPSLIKQLKSILDQYPDDGQILKEMIQNAEDAGATDVTFLFDQHSHGTEKLHQESLAIHQGPSLLAYNNASFTKEDWNGIRRLYDSIKEKDPLKVGRFGLGFKSVFHITDLPSVLSGQRLLILDPHEHLTNDKNRRTSGKAWDFEKDKRSLTLLPDQFSPYFDLFGCSSNSLKTGQFKGTLFRFPLRRRPSKLSQTIYDDDRMEKLFLSFETDANLVLLFLKKVERIALATRGVKTRVPNINFVVQIAPSCIERVRKERATFLDKVLKSEQVGAGQQTATKQSDQKQLIPTSYVVSIETLRGDTVTNTFLYLVRECYARGEFSTTLQNLREQLEASYLPMVGVAMLLNNAADHSEQPDGQTFCVLPLPREKRSSSGLPVHVNGYFSVSQNRRHLKWKTAGQEEEQDTDVAWNHSLLSEVLPQCYVELIKNVIELQHEGDHGVTLSTVYAAIPNINQVDEKWEHLLEAVFDLLLKAPWLHTSACGGKWVTVRDCVLDDLDDSEMKLSVRKGLLSMGYNIVEPPTHIETAIKRYYQDVETVTPRLLRSGLKTHPATYTDLDANTKMELLEFILQDKKFTELDNICLVPLEDGTFTSFNSHTVYIPSRDIQCSLLPGLESKFLKAAIKESLLATLLKLAENGKTSLKKVTSREMPILIKEVLPTGWQNKEQVCYNPSSNQGPPVQWFEDVWMYLATHHTDLTPFEHLPILPITSPTSTSWAVWTWTWNSTMQLITLSKDPKAIMTNHTGSKLSSKLCGLVKGLGVFPAENVPKYVKKHSEVVGTYIKLPTAEHFLDVLLLVSQKYGIQRVASEMKSGQGISDDVITLLARDWSGYTPRSKHKALLQQLPLFQTTHSTPSKLDFASVCEVTEAVADQRLLPIKLPCRFLLVQDNGAQTVASFLGVKTLSACTILKKHLTPCIQEQTIPPDQIKQVMMYVFENIHNLEREDQEVYDHFSKVAFVETNSHKLLEPYKLFHPNSPLCKSLFSCRTDAFPSGYYAQLEKLAILSEMKLKTEQELVGQDVEMAVLSLQTTKNNAQNSAVSGAILEVLSTMPKLLSTCRPGGQSLLRQVHDLPWVQVVEQRSVQYPKSLLWMFSSSLCKPADVVAAKWAFLAVSVKAVAPSVSPELESALKWDEAPTLQLVVRHLHNVIKAYRADEKPAYLNVILEVYKFFQLSDRQDLLKALTECPCWVWTGDRFVHPDTVVVRNTIINLQPFVQVLPEELQNLQTFFSEMGVKDNVDTVMLAEVLHSVKKKYEGVETFNKSHVSRDLQLVIDILNYIRDVKDLDETVRERIFLPVHCSSQGKLELSLVKDCTYCDIEWIRHGYAIPSFNDEEEPVRLIHGDLPLDTARELGVPALINRIMNADELQFTAFGQSESLTSRISHLLEDYTDGLAVVKEMLQNADDAGATEIKFLYDERTNDDALVQLIDPDMNKCQGPALWVYNDVEFKEKDFTNIISLGNTSKEEARDKVGQFGLGFNVVYNLTDVPSFITGESIVIFDPNTNHLSKVIKDKSSPGIKLNIRQNKRLFKSCPDQLKPYQGIYGCDLSDQSQGYPATLFRLPLRTATQAATSNLCQLKYDKKQMIRLLQMLEQNAQNLLLFTQNVRKIDLDHLPDGRDPEQPVQVFSAQKAVINMIEVLSPSGENTSLSRGTFGILAFAAASADASSSEGRISLIMETTKTVFPGSRDLLFSQKEISTKNISLCKPSRRPWLISCVIDNHSAVVLSQKKLFPIGCVAMQLKEVDGGYLPQSLINIKERGQVFCGLPLPVYSDLPVHINATFAVQSSRKGLIQSTGDDKHNEKLDWNKSLLKGVLAEAYLSVLEHIVKVLTKSADTVVNFHRMWPAVKQSETADQLNVEPLLDSFFSKILERGTSPILCCGTVLVTIDDAVLLDADLVTDKETEEDVMKTLTNFLPNAKPVKLPHYAYKQLKRGDANAILDQKWYKFGRYFREIVFPNFECIEDQLRDRLLSFALKRSYFFQEMLSDMDVSECVGLLASVKKVYNEESLSKPSLSITVKVLENLGIMMLKEKVTIEQLTEAGSIVYIPNEQNVLMPLKTLYYTNAAALKGRKNKTEEIDNIVSSEVPLRTVRSLGVKCRLEYVLDENSEGIPFGQCEDLTNAIKRVLDTYPCDHEILKELIQNADDAGATTIHFVYDPRTHPCDKVFSDSWKPLQGPALCVYSDSPFTEADLKGIQQFGIGAKGQDPTKTGQYGIGFSSVYHLTDAPSLLTSGPDIPKTLCVFDPHCQYVRGAKAQTPGRRYKKLAELEEECPDVFRGYLKEHFDIENATMLRLPLRDASMAETSLLSNKSHPDIRQIFELLKNEAREILLFLSNIRAIEISEISQTGIKESIYKVEAQVSANGQEDLNVKDSLPEGVKGALMKMQPDAWHINSISQSTWVKHLDIIDSKGGKQKWCVVECLGMEPTASIPATVGEAITNGELRLLPRGGVAAPISQPNINGRAFCFLPMPLETKLPVHVNGHFALGHENRRHLWTNSERGGYRKEWNDLLCEHVISVAYVELLIALKEIVSTDGAIQGTLEHQLRHHQSYFPTYTEENKNWQVLVDACYKRMASTEVHVLPIITTMPVSEKNSEQETDYSAKLMMVKWHRFQAKGKLKVFFRDNRIEAEHAKSRLGYAARCKEQEKKDILDKCLIRCHFALVHMNETLTTNFERAGDVAITRMSPKEVLVGFPERPLCKEGVLPMDIDKTPFQNKETLLIVLKYCAREEPFMEKLDGLPLLLTAANELRKFERTRPVHFTSSTFQNLLPACKSMFVEAEIFHSVFNTGAPCAVMKPFDIKAMSEKLETQLPVSTFGLNSEVSLLDLNLDTKLLEKWLKLFWYFIEKELGEILQNEVSKLGRCSQEVEEAIRKQLAADRKQKIITQLKCIEDWCLIPTEKLGKSHLVAIRDASRVLWCDNKNGEISRILYMYGVHELKTQQLTAANKSETLPQLVTTTEDVRGCLRLLHSKLQLSPQTISSPDAVTLLQFFCTNIKLLRQDTSSINELKDLSIHQNIYVELSRLAGFYVCILPDGTPINGMEVSQENSRTLFLNYSESLKPLYQFLGCEFLSVVFFYCRFIFPHFEMFNDQDRNVHLHHVYKMYFSDEADTENEKTQLLHEMKDLALFADQDGSLQRASYFYDQRNPVFAVFNPQLAPPSAERPFRSENWTDFLTELGLVTEVSTEEFLGFALEIAEQGKQLHHGSSAHEQKSKTLMQYIFNMKQSCREEAADPPIADSYLQTISAINFIEPATAISELTRLCQVQMAPSGYMQLCGSIPQQYEELVWTQVQLLPRWADPETAYLEPNERDELRQVSEIQVKPPIRIVVSHLRELAEYLSSNTLDDTQSLQVKRRIFKNIYEYIQDNKEDTDVSDLSTTHCILVDNGNKLVIPGQVVRNLPDEIEPFLYRMPDTLVAFQELFIQVGATETPSTAQYVEVLNKLHEKTRGEFMFNPNLLRSAYKAIKGLFSVHEHDFPECALYLPSEKGTLVLSSKLVYNDMPSFFNRIRGFNGTCLINLVECGLEPSLAIRVVHSLPERHRPTLLSSVIEEDLASSVQQTKNGKTAQKLNKRIHADKFRESVKQLLLHEESFQSQSRKQEELDEMANRLKLVTVHTVDRVNTVLKQNGGILPGSSVDKMCHVQKSGTQGWSIYITEGTSLSQNHLIPVANVINEILDGRLHDTILYLLPLLTCSEDDIVGQLEKLNVQTGSLHLTVREPVLPRPGTQVPLTHIETLEHNVSSLRVGDYVSYKSGDGALPVYAIVTEIIASTRFQLNNGSGEALDVEADKLRTFGET